MCHFFEVAFCATIKSNVVKIILVFEKNENWNNEWTKREIIDKAVDKIFEKPLD